MLLTWSAAVIVATNRLGNQELSMLVHTLRLQRGWSQEHLAEMSGLSTRTVQRIEAGGRASTESLKAIASVLETEWTSLREPDMQNGMTGKQAIDEALALAQVRRQKRFFVHLGEFVVITGAMIALNLYFTPTYLWFIWLLTFWTIGIIVMGLRTFQVFPFMSGDWERRQVERKLRRPI